MAQIPVLHIPVASASHVLVPPAPQVPPEDRDVILAYDLPWKIQGARQQNPRIPESEYAASIRYKTAVLSYTPGAQPPGLALALELALLPLQNQINERFDAIDQRLDAMNTRTTQTARIMSKIHNSGQPDGLESRLEIVPFPDNTYPAEGEPPFPILNSVGAVRALSGVNATRYLQKYCPGEPVPRNNTDKIAKLLKVLGCRF